MIGQKNGRMFAKGLNGYRLHLYAIDLSSWIAWQHIGLDASGIPYDTRQEGSDPKLVMQYALVHWDRYLITGNSHHQTIFLQQTDWLVRHACLVGNDAAGWMIPPTKGFQSGSPCLSAAVQGAGLSTLVRAYQLTHKAILLEMARRIARTFERDILDGGVSAPVGENGSFFQAVAGYPASHQLCGFLVALLGLYDYLSFTGDVLVKDLTQRALTTLHGLLDEFDLGYWTRSDLLSTELASSAHLALQIALLKALARASGCTHCFKLASRWRSYEKCFSCHLRSLAMRNMYRSRRALLRQVRARFFPRVASQGRTRVCVPVYGFPVMGGTRAVLENMAEVMKDHWDIEY